MLAVNRDGQLRSEIRPPANVAVFHLRAEAFGLIHRIFAVLVRDSVLPDDDLVVHTRFVDVAEDLAYAAQRSARRSRPTGDLDDDHVGGFCVEGLSIGNLDVHDHPAIEGHDEPES